MDLSKLEKHSKKNIDKMRAIRIKNLHEYYEKTEKKPQKKTDLNLIKKSFYEFPILSLAFILVIFWFLFKILK